jgi:hypothetical protein
MLEKVTCEVCKKEYYTIAPLHLKTHGLTMKEYRSLYPNAIIHSDTIKLHIGLKSLGNKVSTGIPSYKKGIKLVDLVGVERAKEIGSKISKNNKGRPKKFSLSRLIKQRSPDFKLMMSELKRKQFKENPDIIKKHSESLKQGFKSGKIKLWNKGLKYEDDERVRTYVDKGAKIKGDGRFKGENNALYGKTFEEIYGEEKANELKKGMVIRGEILFRSERLNQIRKSPEYLRNKYNAAHRKPNNKEIMLMGILDELCPNEYKYNGDYSLGVSFDGLVPDFWNVNGQKKVIEHLGDYYHGELIQKHPKDVEEKEKIDRYGSCGVKCLVIWEHELVKSNRMVLIEKIKKFNMEESHEKVV